jgi:hypothetical protein
VAGRVVVDATFVGDEVQRHVLGIRQARRIGNGTLCSAKDPGKVFDKLRVASYRARRTDWLGS